MNRAAARHALRAWIVERNGDIRPEEIADDTPILERRIVSSLQLMDLILYVEQLSGRPIDPAWLRPGAFESVNAICDTFVRDAGS